MQSAIQSFVAHVCTVLVLIKIMESSIALVSAKQELMVLVHDTNQ